MNYILQHSDVLAATIAGTCGMIATIIAALTASLIGRKFSNRQKLQENFEKAKSDIEFLLAVERAHCERNKIATGKTLKNVIRAEVLKTTSCRWSGRFTSSRIR
jgi:hypothetical protein